MTTTTTTSTEVEQHPDGSETRTTESVTDGVTTYSDEATYDADGRLIESTSTYVSDTPEAVAVVTDEPPAEALGEAIGDAVADAIDEATDQTTEVVAGAAMFTVDAVQAMLTAAVDVIVDRVTAALSPKASEADDDQGDEPPADEATEALGAEPADDDQGDTDDSADRTPAPSRRFVRAYGSSGIRVPRKKRKE